MRYMEISSSSGQTFNGARAFSVPAFATTAATSGMATATSGLTRDTALLDTNILVYAYNADSEYHAACRALLDRAIRGELNICLAPQILFEFFAVVTNLARVTKPIIPIEALAEMTKLVDCLPR